MTKVLPGRSFDTNHYKNLYQIFEESNVTSSEGNNLVEIDAETCTYAELCRKADLLAVKFLEIGLKKGSKVGILIPNGIKRIAALVALIKTGIIFVPLDSVLSQEKVDDILHRSGAELVITAGDNENTAKELIKTFSIDDTLNNRSSEDFVHPSTTEEINANDVVCILFTSGSSGVPKGIKLTHENLINRLLWYYEEFPYESNEILCSKTNMLFVDFYTETLSAVLKQMPIVLLKQHHYRDITLFTKILKEQQVTRLVLVPSLLKCLNASVSSESAEMRLKHVVCSGETLSYEVAKQCLSNFPQISLYNFYGSTEVTDVLFKKFSIDEISKAGNSIIGLPIYNTNVYIDLVDGEETSGELYVAGSNVTAGYIGNEQENGAFVANPYDNHPKFSRIFKTGDFVKLTDYGLEYLGRRDDFVKVRGHKVNLNNVEDTLKKHLPSTQIRVLSKFSCVTSETQIYAFIECAKSCNVPPDFSFVKAQFPAHMIPKIIPVKKMPLTPSSGKIDRQMLLGLIKEETHYNQVPQNIKNAIPETKIRYVACKVLDITAEDLDVTKTFFQLGGNSLTAFAFIQELEKIGIHWNFDHLIQQNSILDVTKKTAKTNVDTSDKSVKVVSVETISEDQVKFAAMKMSEMFSSNEPLTMHIGYQNNFVNLAIECKRNYPSYGAVAKIGNDIVGAVFNSPMNVPEPFSTPDSDENILELLSACEHDVMEGLIKANHNVLHSNVLYTDVTLSNSIAAQVFYKLSTEVISIAERHQHTAIITTDTNPTTILLDKDLGFVAEKVMYPKVFCHNGKYPFKLIDEGYKITTHVKYL